MRVTCMGTERSKERSLDRLKEDLTKFFQAKEEVNLAYLFGSCLRGKAVGRHDIDIAVLIDPKLLRSIDENRPYGYQAEMNAKLINLLKHNRIDLIILNEATSVLAYEVIHNGVLLFSRSEDLRVQFEVSSLKRHADTKHLRDIKRIYSKMRTERGLPSYA